MNNLQACECATLKFDHQGTAFGELSDLQRNPDFGTCFR